MTASDPSAHEEQHLFKRNDSKPSQHIRSMLVNNQSPTWRLNSKTFCASSCGCPAFGTSEHATAKRRRHTWAPGSSSSLPLFTTRIIIKVWPSVSLTILTAAWSIITLLILAFHRRHLHQRQYHGHTQVAPFGLKPQIHTPGRPVSSKLTGYPYRYLPLSLLGIPTREVAASQDHSCSTSPERHLGMHENPHAAVASKTLPTSLNSTWPRKQPHHPPAPHLFYWPFQST